MCSHPRRLTHGVCIFILDFASVVWTRLRELWLRWQGRLLGAGRQIAWREREFLWDLMGGVLVGVGGHVRSFSKTPLGCLNRTVGVGGEPKSAALPREFAKLAPSSSLMSVT